MIKRATKLTSVLLAAASIMSTIPASAATRLGTKDGTIENAVAYKDGHYIYQGYRTDDDDENVYFNENSKKDKELDDATELGNKYGDKYVSAKDGSDEYIVDLSNGKITDDDTITDLKDTAKTKLETKLKKANRYDGNYTINDNNFNQVGANEFGDVWYSYKNTTGFGYTNQSGHYIDCSYDLNAYVLYGTTTSGAKMYKLEDMDDKQKVTIKKIVNGSEQNVDVTIKPKSITSFKYLAQDEKYIYSLITVEFENSLDIRDLSKTDNTLAFIQKVSKTQGDKKEGAYKPKSTECFQVMNKAKDSDISEVADILTDSTAKIRAVDGALYVAYEDDDKVKVQKINLRTSEKIGVNDSKQSSDKVSARVAKKADDAVKTKIDSSDNKSWTFDVNGNVWAIYNGEISKSTKGGDFKVIYTCDRSLDCIDVYDDDNLIAWDKNGDVYTTVQEGKDQAKEDAEEIIGKDDNNTDNTVKSGWNQDTNGNWTLTDSVGNKITGWYNDNGTWFYLNSTTGVMETGWIYNNGTWYYLNPVSDGTRGAMKTGWIYANGAWYYLNPVSDGTRGAMKTGWINDNGTWYYCNSSGAMQTGWVQVNGTWYYFYQSGAMAHDTYINGYRLASSGAWV